MCKDNRPTYAGALFVALSTFVFGLLIGAGSIYVFVHMPSVPESSLTTEPR